MRRMWKLFVMQFKLYLREPVAFFFTLAYPTMLLLLFGFIYGNQPDIEFWGREFGTVDASVPAYAGIIIGTVALMGIPIDTATSRETGILRRYRATPLHPAVYLIASVAVYLAIALLGMAIFFTECRCVLLPGLPYCRCGTHRPRGTGGGNGDFLPDDVSFWCRDASAALARGVTESQ
jgi:ABC-2 type transport system permease protein